MYRKGSQGVVCVDCLIDRDLIIYACFCFRAYLITDMMSRTLDICTSGATAVSALIVRSSSSSSGESGSDSRMLYVANAGDSRAVLCSMTQPQDGSTAAAVAIRLSCDHTAEDPGEQARIKEAGGFITRGRVLGILAVSRSFGDHGMKDFVTASPHVTATDISAGADTHPFLILACDGT